MTDDKHAQWSLVFTWVLLHVIKPPLPVDLHQHLLTHLQRWAHKVYSFWSLSCHPQNLDIFNQPMVVWLKEQHNKVRRFSGRIKSQTDPNIDGHLTWPPPSGNKMVSWSFTLKPLTVSFLPLTSRLSSAGQQETTEVTNCKETNTEQTTNNNKV